MGVSVRAIRVGLLAGAGLLTLTLAGLLGYAHWRARYLGRALASRMGANITQETNGFTYSQSQKGRTIFTIHAAKAVQRHDGKVTLHDVGIVLYGREGDRADRIYGDEFEYDQATGEARATGDVRIDLQAPAAAFRGKVEGGIHESELLPGAADDRVVHVRTQGLLFQQKLGLASTPGLLEFRSGGLSGSATGASYDSQTGKVVLESAVSMSGLVRNRPGHLTAAHAEFEQTAHRVVLTSAIYTTTNQRLASDQISVLTARDGTPQTVQSAGHVAVSAGQRQVLAGRMDAALTPAGKPHTAHLYEEVQFSEPGSQGHAAAAQVVFDSEGRATQVQLSGKVAGEQHGPVSTRTFAANRTEMTLIPTGPGRSSLKEAKASGNVSLHEVRNEDKRARSDVAADTLTADFAVIGGLSQLSSVTGSGHTVLHQTTAAGTDETSSGETLTAKFRSGIPRPNGSSTLVSAVQRGSVRMLRVLTTTLETQRGVADEEFYDAGTSRLTLRGKAHIEDAANSVYADTITADRVSGDMDAGGAVRISYTQESAPGTKAGPRPEPVHVLADHATLRKQEQSAVFSGIPGRPGRLWQGASQVEAPELEFEQASRRLIARGNGAAVHALLSDATEPSTAKAAKVHDAVRASSDTMVYSDLTREVELTSHVRVEDPNGIVTADHATVFLKDSNGPKSAAMPLPQGQVQRIVATGDVHIEQPNRHADGDRLVYTADDKTFLLTGTKAAPPRLFDQARGTVTGSAFRFHSGDQSVLVSGGDGASGPRRVKTETRVKQ